jgi:hypothetical protein
MPRNRGENLYDVIDELVVAQGNEFVKELLRRKGLPIGTTKSDFETSLHAAIKANKLTSLDLQEWLNEVEGWGAHHAYLFRVAKSQLRNLLKDKSRITSALAKAGLAKIAETPKPFAFPVQLTPCVVRLNRDRIEIIWHRGTESWLADPTKNYRNEQDGDLYEYRAYRRRADRSVVRFVAAADLGIAAILVGMPLGEEHADAHSKAFAIGSGILSAINLTSINIGKAQLRLDSGTETEVMVSSHRSRMRHAGAYVEFGSSVPDGNYKAVDAIRQVRLAARSDLNGEVGDFDFQVSDDASRRRVVRVNLNADDRRVYIRAQLTQDEEWKILQRVAIP